MTKILIVDDEILVRVGIKSAIDWQSNGFEIVGEACNGQEALDILHNKEVDILLLDIEMPVMNGIRLLEIINEEGIEVRVIILSCHDDFEFARKALINGAFDYILKLSLDPDNLLDRLISIQSDIKKETIRMKKTDVPDIEETLIELVKGHCPPVWETQMKRGIKLVNGSMLAFIVHVDRYKSQVVKEKIQDLDLFKKSIINVISEIINDYATGDSFQWDEGIFVGIINTKRDDPFQLKEIAENIQNALWRYMQVSVSIAMGAMVEDVGSLNDSFTSAESISKKRFYIGNKAIIFYDKKALQTEKNSNEILFDTKMEKKLSHSIEYCDEVQSVNVINRYFGLVRKMPYGHRIQGVYREVDEILYVFAKELKLHSQKFEDIPGYETIIPRSELRYIEFLDDLYDWLRTFIRLYFKHLHSLQDTTVRRDFQKIAEYIQEHYQEDLKVSMMAKQANMSSSYFGTQFKQVFGSSLSNYLTDYRMDRARELLRSTDMSITEVSDHVGYENIYYFSNVFKKNFGLSPNQYRRSRS